MKISLCSSFIYIQLTFLVLLYKNSVVHCWTDEDLELFDLVENTDRNFYHILGVDQKASASDIRKAYRKLSTLYHPDKNKESNAEETFRKIAAIADVLRNEEQRKKYDVILQTGLPDWREPIYYYRRVRNMGLLELVIFLFALATVGQYLFAWSSYWEKKYEIEELVLSKLRKKAKQQRKGRMAKDLEDIDPSTLEIYNIPKPRCQDLFPVQLFYFFLHCIMNMPTYLKLSLECFLAFWKKSNDDNNDEDESESESKAETKIRTKRHVKPQYPDLPSDSTDVYGNCSSKNAWDKGTLNDANEASKKNEESKISQCDLSEFKKALKKFPYGTLQRWEKIGEYLNCSVNEVVSMTKQLKSQQITRNVSISTQGLTGVEDNINSIKFNSKMELNAMKHGHENGFHLHMNGNGTAVAQRVNHQNENSSLNNSNTEKSWKQEEQKQLEVALQKFPKDVPARWDRISEFVQTKTKEECITRYKELAQQIKRKKCKES